MESRRGLARRGHGWKYTTRSRGNRDETLGVVQLDQLAHLGGSVLLE